MSIKDDKTPSTSDEDSEISEVSRTPSEMLRRDEKAREAHKKADNKARKAKEKAAKAAKEKEKIMPSREDFQITAEVLWQGPSTGRNGNMDSDQVQDAEQAALRTFAELLEALKEAMKASGIAEPPSRGRPPGSGKKSKLGSRAHSAEPSQPGISVTQGTPTARELWVAMQRL